MSYMSASDPSSKIVDDCSFAIVLSAGRSGRMGKEKAALPWLGGKMLLPWMVDALGLAGWQPRVVLNPAGFDFWNEVLPSGCSVLNPEPERGKTTSIAVGAQSVSPSAKWILITSVDQPRPPELYLKLREAAEQGEGEIIVPERMGRRGHPVVMAGTYRDALMNLTEQNLGLRGLLDANEAKMVRLNLCDEEWLKWDLNTPADYEEAFRFFRSKLVS